MKQDKFLSIEELYKAMKETGLSSGKSWVLRQEKKGNLTLRKIPNTGHKKVIESDIEEIIKAYSPGGIGRWHCDATPTAV